MQIGPVDLDESSHVDTYDFVMTPQKRLRRF